jgi:hypothetical protein
MIKLVIRAGGEPIRQHKASNAIFINVDRGFLAKLFNPSKHKFNLNNADLTSYFLRHREHTNLLKHQLICDIQELYCCLF